GMAEDAPQEPTAVPAPGPEAAADGLTIGVDEGLRRSGAGLRQRLREQQGPPDAGAVPDAVLAEGVRAWGAGLDALGQAGAALVAAAEAVVSALAAGAGLSETGPAPDRAGPFLPEAPAAEEPVPPGERQQPAGVPESRPGEDRPTLADVLVVAGLVSG